MSKSWREGHVEKFGDVPDEEARRRRHLPPIDRHQPVNPYSEVELRREADARFVIKRSR